LSVFSSSEIHDAGNIFHPALGHGLLASEERGFLEPDGLEKNS